MLVAIRMCSCTWSTIFDKSNLKQLCRGQKTYKSIQVLVASLLRTMWHHMLYHKCFEHVTVVFGGNILHEHFKSGETANMASQWLLQEISWWWKSKVQGLRSGIWTNWAIENVKQQQYLLEQGFEPATLRFLTHYATAVWTSYLYHIKVVNS